MHTEFLFGICCGHRQGKRRDPRSFWDITLCIVVRIVRIVYWIFEPRSQNRYVVPKNRYGITTVCCIISQKSPDLTRVLPAA